MFKKIAEHRHRQHIGIHRLRADFEKKIASDRIGASKKINRIASDRRKNESDPIVGPAPLQNKAIYKNKSDRIASAKNILTIWIDLYRNIFSNDFHRWKIVYFYIKKW